LKDYEAIVVSKVRRWQFCQVSGSKFRGRQCWAVADIGKGGPRRQGKLETAGLHQHFESKKWRCRASLILARGAGIIRTCSVAASLSSALWLFR